MKTKKLSTKISPEPGQTVTVIINNAPKGASITYQEKGRDVLVKVKK